MNLDESQISRRKDVLLEDATARVPRSEVTKPVSPAATCVAV